MSQEKHIENGFYRHYKGGVYYVCDEAVHSETEEIMVIYRDANDKTWCRSIQMFLETVNAYGFIMPRFEKITSEELKRLFPNG